MTDPCPHALDDAAYVLGALSSEERLAFERHLATCPACADAVRELAGMPGLLGRVPREVLEGAPAPEPVPETLLPRLLDDVRRAQRRRRWAFGLAAAAAVAMIAAVSVAIGVTTDSGDDAAPPSATRTTAPPEEMTPIGDSGDIALVSMTPTAWGTRLDLECRWSGEGEKPDYPQGGGGTYALVVRSADGDEQQVATWRSVPGRTTQVSAATSIDRDDIVAVEVRSADGRPTFELAG